MLPDNHWIHWITMWVVILGCYISKPANTADLKTASLLYGINAKNIVYHTS